MKIRSGFVSNSSSSSFIVAFDRDLEDYFDSELKVKLFGTDGSVMRGPYGSELLNVDELLHEVQMGAKKIKINEDFSYSFEGSEEKLFFNGEDYWDASDQAKRNGFDIRADRDAYFKEIKRITQISAEKKMRTFLEGVKNSVENPRYYWFSFSDDSNKGCLLEHGDIFREFAHLVEDNH